MGRYDHISLNTYKNSPRIKIYNIFNILYINIIYILIYIKYKIYKTENEVRVSLKRMRVWCPLKAAMITAWSFSALKF